MWYGIFHYKNQFLISDDTYEPHIFEHGSAKKAKLTYQKIPGAPGGQTRLRFHWHYSLNACFRKIFLLINNVWYNINYFYASFVVMLG